MGAEVLVTPDIAQSERKVLEVVPSSPTTPPETNGTRKEVEDEFDLVVIGGGATGAGCALDAASR